MERRESPDSDVRAWLMSPAVWRTGTSLLVLLSTALLILVFRYEIHGTRIPTILFLLVTAAFAVVLLSGIAYLVRALGEHRESEERFQQMAGNIGEVFWMIDAQTKKVLYVNEAYEAITGRSRQSIMKDPTACREIIHPEDREYVIARLEEASFSGEFEKRFRIVCSHGAVRWIKVHGFPVRDSRGEIRRLVGTAQEITAQKQAEDEVAKNLRAAESAWAEADALRKATLSLTQDLRMDFVMEALLGSLEDLIPYTCARVLVPQGGPHLLALGERQSPEPMKRSSAYPLTLLADESPFLQRVIAEQKSVLIQDTHCEEGWQTFQGHQELRSWLSVPLVASDEYLGMLSVGHTTPNRYTREHLRRAELLAIPAAAAIENARLYQTAQIYGAELENRLSDLRKAKAALEESEENRRATEEKFQMIFRHSPIPFSITTVSDGTFLDVNTAWERRYGYSRAEVIGRSIGELRIWEDPKDRILMVAQLQKGPIRNVVTRLRTKSGEVRVSAYSAAKIHFDGQPCILAVSEDPSSNDQKLVN
jgi:PAS domain S-box-containing protein